MRQAYSFVGSGCSSDRLGSDTSRFLEAKDHEATDDTHSTNDDAMVSVVDQSDPCIPVILEYRTIGVSILVEIRPEILMGFDTFDQRRFE